MKEQYEKENSGKMVGCQSIRFTNPPRITAAGSIAGKKEGEGPLGKEIDVVGEDDKFGEDSWESAESTLQKEALGIALGKAGLKSEDVRYLFAGDLLGQEVATTFGLQQYEIPLFGLYGACSTCGESLSLAAMTVSAGYADCAAAVTSSHFASAERQFRYPLEYANQRALCSTWTVTGSGAFLLESKRGYEKRKSQGKHILKNVHITGITTGKVVDFGVRDSMNMGAAMAPAAADLIYTNLTEFDRKPSDYDKIITGDLGAVGKEILLDFLARKGMDISPVYTDCGLEIFDCGKQGTDSGGSGCGCSAVTLASHFLPMIERGDLKRILFVPTGALLSKVSFNEGQNVPGIAHGVIIEHIGGQKDGADAAQKGEG